MLSPAPEIRPRGKEFERRAFFREGKTLHSNKQNIYLTWGGDIYGPASKEDVIAGIRTASFEEGALYWHEGLEEWKPVREFPASETPEIKDWRRVMPRDLPTAPELPTKKNEASLVSNRPRRSRASKPSSLRPGRGGRAIFLGIAVLAVLLTVGILLLLMRV